MAGATGTIIVTGTAGGLGNAFVESYLEANLPYEAIFTVRSAKSESSRPLKDLVAASEHLCHVESLDLSVLENVRSFADSVNARVAQGSLQPIRVLLMNAGMQDIPGLRMTADGFERTFAVNYLANFLLTLLLLKSLDREHGRIVFVSSSAHDPNHWLNAFNPDANAWREPEELARRPLPDRKGDERNGAMRRYGASKLWLLMFMYELQRRLDRTPAFKAITTRSFNPGAVMDTGLTRDHGLVMHYILTPAFIAMARMLPYIYTNPTFRIKQTAATDMMNVCFKEDGPIYGSNPKAIYVDGCQIVNSSLESKDVEKQRELWIVSLKLVGLTEADLELEPA